MIPQLPREYVQLVSLALFCAGAAILAAGGWHDELGRSVGITFMAGSIWFIMMSESILLGKVQTQMHEALDQLSKKREREVHELLEFLKATKLHTERAEKPFDSTESALPLMSRLGIPAMIQSPSFMVLAANKRMSDLLGWEEGSMKGLAGHIIQDNTLMSRVGEICGSQDHAYKSELSLRYMYIHKGGAGLFGVLSLIKMKDGCFFILFHPDSDHIVTQKKLEEIMS